MCTPALTLTFSQGMDCGLESMKLFREKVLASKTVIWNGPAGVFEFDTFSKGTKARGHRLLTAPRPRRTTTPPHRHQPLLHPLPMHHHHLPGYENGQHPLPNTLPVRLLSKQSQARSHSQLRLHPHAFLSGGRPFSRQLLRPPQRATKGSSAGAIRLPLLPR